MNVTFAAWLLVVNFVVAALARGWFGYDGGALPILAALCWLCLCLLADGYRRLCRWFDL